jgi:hypothetical protein
MLSCIEATVPKHDELIIDRYKEINFLLSNSPITVFIEYELPLYIQETPHSFNDIYKHYKAVYQTYPIPRRPLKPHSLLKLIQNDSRFHFDGDTVMMTVNE